MKEKRAECDAAEKEFSEVKAKLKEKQQFLCKVEAQLVELTQQTEESILERDELQEKCMQNKRHIERATVLMEALVGEQVRKLLLTILSSLLANRETVHWLKSVTNNKLMKHESNVVIVDTII